MVIEPTVGRVVWYQLASHDAIVQRDGQPCVALITCVHGPRMINIVGWDANGTFFFRSSVTLLQEGDELDFPDQQHCTWMPYQIGQAKKHAEDVK
jgi:hypothetical protein